MNLWDFSHFRDFDHIREEKAICHENYASSTFHLNPHRKLSILWTIFIRSRRSAQFPDHTNDFFFHDTELRNFDFREHARTDLRDVKYRKRLNIMFS